MSTLSEKNTKKELLEGIAELTEKYQRMLASNVSPSQQIERREEEVLKESAACTCADDVVTTVSNTFAITVNLMKDAVDKYKDVISATKIAEKELVEYYNIKKETNTLLAMLEAKKEAIRILDLEKQEKTEECTTNVGKLRTYYDTLNKELSDKMKKQEEEYDYTFKRSCMLKENDLSDKLMELKKRFDDECTALRKGIDTDHNTLATDYEKFRAETTAFGNVQEKVAELESYKEKYKDKIIELAVVKKDNTHEVALLASKYDNEINLLKSKIEMLTQEMAKKDVAIIDLSEKLDEAYQSVKGIAADAINGAAQNGIISTLKDVATSKDNKNVK